VPDHTQWSLRLRQDHLDGLAGEVSRERSKANLREIKTHSLISTTSRAVVGQISSILAGLRSLFGANGLKNRCA
jgi:hypothetical protein